MSADAEKKYCRPLMLDQILGGGHRIIDASAGTGKTFAIEYVVADLILTGSAQLDQILIVTFTEKATAELRCRIRSTIENVLAGEAADTTRSSQGRTLNDDERGRLDSALFAFYTAPIHTIHSFCHRMLTELAFDSGARFGLDLASGRLEFHKALRAELRERLKSDAVVQSLVADWLADEKRDADSLEDSLWSAHQQRYLRTNGRELNRQALTDFIACFDSETLAEAYKIASITPEARDRALDAMRELERIVSGAAGAPEKLGEGLLGFDFARILEPEKTRKRSNRFPQDMSSNVRAIVEAFARVEAALAVEARVADELLPGVLRRMDARKRERGTLDYEDMLAWLADALDAERGKSLAAALRDRYRVVLIDEFQDTDQLQWTIFRRVFVDDDAGITVYVIGDPKQAIYAFRGADVHAYLEACRHLSARGAKIVRLRENFRSTAAMIDAYNLIFDQNAREPIFNGEIKYDPPVTCGKKALSAVAPSGNRIAPITLLKFNPGNDRYKFSRRMREAIGVKLAHEIRSILNDADRAIAIRDGHDASRRVTAKDIYVLTRSNRDSSEIAKYLRQTGVPYAFCKQDGLFQTREAAWILDLLRGIENPGRRSSRLKAWASPFFAVDYADLARLEDDRNSHPMLEQLFEWRALAEAGRFAELFDSLLHQ
ncbi:MAG: UvrD-helicase domain-containing protein, partial [Candidatus Binatus sp.]